MVNETVVSLRIPPAGVWPLLTSLQQTCNVMGVVFGYHALLSVQSIWISIGFILKEHKVILHQEQALLFSIWLPATIFFTQKLPDLGWWGKMYTL